MTSPVPTSYTPATWYDDQSGGTPIDADALNHIEGGIAGAYSYAAQSVVTPTTSNVTGNYTASAGQFILADATNASFTVTLPSAFVGARVTMKKIDTSANQIFFGTTGNQTIDLKTIGSGNTPSLRMKDETRTFIGTATGWLILNGVNAISALDSRYVAMFMPVNYGFHATLAADLALAANTNVQLTNLTVNTNQGGFTLTSGALTIPATPYGAPSRWRVQFHGRFPNVSGYGNAATVRILTVNRNSTTLTTGSLVALNTLPSTNSINGDIMDCQYSGPLATGDVLRFWAYSYYASTLSSAAIVTNAPYDTWIDVSPIGLV